MDGFGLNVGKKGEHMATTLKQTAAEAGKDEELRSLRERVSMLEAVVENFPGGLLLFDKNLRLAFCNQRQRKMLDYPDWFFSANPPTISEIFWYNATRGEYGAGDPADHVEHRMALVAKREGHVFERRRPNGTLLEIRGQPLEGGGFVTTYLDITEQRKGQDALRYLANHDVLTNLPNRFSAMGELESRIARLQPGSSLAVVFLDLNGFKPVNDRYGHAIGDELLKNVAHRLSHSIRESDHISRYGGDEFVILMNCGSGRHEAEMLAERLEKSLSGAFYVGDIELFISASIGIAVCPEDGVRVEELVSAADKHMYVAKRNGVSYLKASALGR